MRRKQYTLDQRAQRINEFLAMADTWEGKATNARVHAARELYAVKQEIADDEEFQDWCAKEVKNRSWADVRKLVNAAETGDAEGALAKAREADRKRKAASKSKATARNSEQPDPERSQAEAVEEIIEMWLNLSIKYQDRAFEQMQIAIERRPTIINFNREKTYA